MWYESCTTTTKYIIHIYKSLAEFVLCPQETIMHFSWQANLSPTTSTSFGVVWTWQNMRKIILRNVLHYSAECRSMVYGMKKDTMNVCIVISFEWKVHSCDMKLVYIFTHDGLFTKAKYIPMRVYYYIQHNRFCVDPVWMCLLF